MRLVQLRLKNFRQHADTVIDFGEGMTAIVGANGSGKSTVLEAITFALYGEQRETRETVRFLWTEERGFSVGLRFEFDGKTFVVERRTNDAVLKELRDPERIWASGLRPVSETCERLLGLTYDQFRNSFFAEQKGLAFLQFGNKRARQEEVARMLGFHRLKAAEDLAAQRRTALGGQVATLEAVVGDAQEVEAAKEDAELLHRATVEEVRAATETLATIEADLVASERTFEAANQWMRATAEIRREEGALEGLRHAVVLTEEEVRRADAEAEVFAVLSANEEAYRQAQHARDAWLADWQTAKGQAQARLGQAQEALGKARVAFAAGVCAECGQRIGPDYASVVEDRSREQEALRRQLAELEGRKPPELPTELVAGHERYLALKGAEGRRHERARANSEARRRVSEVEGRLARLRSGLADYDETQAVAKIAAHQTRLQTAASARTRLTETRRRLELAEQQLRQAVERLAETRRRTDELRALRAELAHTTAVVQEMRKLRTALNAGIGPDLAARASENLSLLTNGRYDTLTLDEDFGAHLVEDGVTKGVISGGEEDVVALALRLALSELIQERQGRPMSLLILDEVFGSLDTDRRQSVLDRLASLKGRFGQILVVSHIEEINQVADRCLYLSRDPRTRATLVSDAPPGGFAELG